MNFICLLFIIISCNTQEKRNTDIKSFYIRNNTKPFFLLKNIYYKNDKYKNDSIIVKINDLNKDELINLLENDTIAVDSKQKNKFQDNLIVRDNSLKKTKDFLLKSELKNFYHVNPEMLSKQNKNYIIYLLIKEGFIVREIDMPYLITAISIKDLKFLP